MKSFRSILEVSEKEFEIPGTLGEFDHFGQDIKSYIENVWPELIQWVLMDFAINLHIDIFLSSPIEQKLYLSLKKRYIRYFLSYSDRAVLFVNKKLSDISNFLVKHKHDRIFHSGEIDYEIDLFLYLNCHGIEGPRGSFLQQPFMICIECDGHEYHEKTKYQAQKDKIKDRTLKSKGLDTVRFTGSEITINPDKCADEIDGLLYSHFHKLQIVAGQLE